ncbi:hypothetical protein ACEPAG_8412 [Sanghuangporus baumii]
MCLSSHKAWAFFASTADDGSFMKRISARFHSSSPIHGFCGLYYFYFRLSIYHSYFRLCHCPSLTRAS